MNVKTTGKGGNRGRRLAFEYGDSSARLIQRTRPAPAPSPQEDAEPLPPPSAKELAYRQLRAEMNIKTKED